MPTFENDGKDEMTTYRFTGPVRRPTKVGRCPTCGKQTRRTREFQHTVNPFNRNTETGEPKTWDEVSVDVDAEADAWVPDFEHWTCSERRHAADELERKAVEAGV